LVPLSAWTGEGWFVYFRLLEDGKAFLELLQEVDQRLLVCGAQCPKPADDLPRLAAVGL
jgi:hypothetical protein